MARFVVYYFGDHSLKLQGCIGIVALQGPSGSTATVFIRWPYSLHTFDRVLRSRRRNLVDVYYVTAPFRTDPLGVANASSPSLPCER
jgi:hypothetical protein